MWPHCCTVTCLHPFIELLYSLQNLRQAHPAWEDQQAAAPASSWDERLSLRMCTFSPHCRQQWSLPRGPTTCPHSGHAFDIYHCYSLKELWNKDTVISASPTTKLKLWKVQGVLMLPPEEVGEPGFNSPSHQRVPDGSQAKHREALTQHQWSDSYRIIKHGSEAARAIWLPL